MKKNLIFTSLILGLAGAMALTTACNKPAERPAAVDSKIAANLLALKDIGEITSDSKLVYSTTGAQDLSGFAASLKQAKLEGKVSDLLKKITTDANKKALDDQLKTGAIALVVLDDQIKVLKVVSQTSSSFDTQVTSYAYVSALKALSKTSEASSQASIVSQLEALRYKSPSELGETFGLVEISAIKVAQHGNLDNDRTDYNEKKSVLKVIDRPFDVSTYIVIGEEIGSAAEEAAAKAASAEASVKRRYKGL